ncbi:hypothetical protein AB4320_12925 [Vibrio splendidus]
MTTRHPVFAITEAIAMITNIENELLDVNKRTQPIIYTTDSIGFALNDRNCVVICILPCLIPQK